MTTALLQPLLALLEQAERERDEAVLTMERSRKAMTEAANQVQSLRQWRSDYQAKWGAQFAQIGRAEIIRCYQEFMQRLTEAIADQERTAEQRSLTFNTLRAQVQQFEQRVIAVTQLIERRQKEMSLAEQRREQKVTDELASRLRDVRGAALGMSLPGSQGSKLGRSHLWSNDLGQDFINTLT